MTGANAIRILDALKEAGFYVEEAVSAAQVEEMLAGLGRVIHTTDVIANPESKRLVNSTGKLDFHTDHHRADFIAWQCIEQCDEGGETILLDAEEAFSRLTESEREVLYRIRLTEHAVFPDDPREHALLTVKNGKRRFYYSFWLAENVCDPAELAALEAFRAAISALEARKLRLRPGDLLICDNGRMLHGRTAIHGDGRRHLKRYWIAAPDQGKDGMTMTTFTLPTPITKARIDGLKQKGIDPCVAEIDLSMVKLKLQDPTEGKGWTEEQCEEMDLEYKRFLTLNLLFPRSIVPTAAIDHMWHYHILDTRAYHRDTVRVFGGYFHHFPYFGMRGSEDAQNLAKAFERTQELYQQTFGEPMIRSNETNCWHDCDGRCWHACSDEDLSR